MPIICPTITATNQTDYQKQLAEVEAFATRLHVDIADGEFAPLKLVPPQNVYWPKTATADIHVMYQRPINIIETLIGLQPQLIIVPVESDEARAVITELTGSGIKIGLSIQQTTPVEAVRPHIEQIDHVLIFSGDLGHFGGSADLDLLTKAHALKEWRGELEIGWDGGINADNILELSQGGIDVLNVGGAIHNTDDPKAAHALLSDRLEINNAN